MNEVVLIQDLESNVHQPDRNGVQALADSMMAIGLVTPIVVAPKGDKFSIIAGHRRVEAAKQLGWTEIKATVVDAEDEAMQVASLAADNLQREDFTEMQVAELAQTLFDLGQPEALVSDVMGFKAKDLKKAAAIAKQAQEAELDLSAMSIAEASATIEAQPYPVLLAKLEGAKPEQKQHVIAEVMDGVKRERAIETAITKLPEGTEIIDPPHWDEKKIIPLYKLHIDKPSQHKKCPGHAASVTTDWEGKAKVQWYCTDAPQYHGYSEKRQANPSDAKAAAERKAANEFKKTSKPCSEVRQEWLTSHLKQVAKLKGRYAWLEQHHRNREGVRYDGVFAKFLNIPASKISGEGLNAYLPPKEVESIGNARKEQALFAAACAAQEEGLRLAKGTDDWRCKHAKEYLLWLKSNGYTLSDHERQFVDWEKPEPVDWRAVNKDLKILEVVEVDEDDEDFVGGSMEDSIINEMNEEDDVASDSDA